jgi:hypothetical protein
VTDRGELIALLRREGRHSGVWFAHALTEAADALEAAQGIEAGTAETGTGSVHESPVREANAPNLSPKHHPTSPLYNGEGE